MALSPNWNVPYFIHSRSRESHSSSLGVPGMQGSGKGGLPSVLWTPGRSILSLQEKNGELVSVLASHSAVFSPGAIQGPWLLAPALSSWGGVTPRPPQILPPRNWSQCSLLGEAGLPLAQQCLPTQECSPGRRHGLEEGCVDRAPRSPRAEGWKLVKGWEEGLFSCSL